RATALDVAKQISGNEAWDPDYPRGKGQQAEVEAHALTDGLRREGRRKAFADGWGSDIAEHWRY
ncbi:MAG: hypothetical protein AAGM22_32345, partial [Acidobacteriota bacterium]